MDYYIGIDLGGTKIAGGVVDLEGNIYARKMINTNAPRPASDICRDICEICMDLVSQLNIKMSDIIRIGVGSPGVIHDGIIEFARNLDFRDVPFSKMISYALNKPVYLLNDANAAAYGEFLVGAGSDKNCHSLVMMTIGTGIGGGIIINDLIYDGFNGASAELGHLVINAEGEKCKCGKNGCFDLYCSAKAIELSTLEVMKSYPDSVLWKLCSGNTNNIDGKTAFDAYKLGDHAAGIVVDNFVKYLSIGVSNLISLFQPQVFCIGGGVSEQGDAVMKPLARYVITQSYIKDKSRRTKIVAAKLANDAGIIGAALAGIR